MSVHSRPVAIEGQQDCQRLMDVAFAFCRSQCLFAGVELGLFSLLEARSLTVQEVSTQLQISERGVRDFMDALVSIELVSCDAGHYTNSPTASRYLVMGKPSYVGDWCAFIAARLYPVWRDLPEAIRTGIPQNEAKNEPDYYANLGTDTTRLERFLKAMAALSMRPAELIALCFPWSRFRSFVDLGGAAGNLSRRLLEAHRHLNGSVFDLPAVRPYCEITAADCSGRLTCIEGDFFTAALPRADVYILGHVLHNWNVEEKARLLSKVHGAVSPGGAVIIYEWLLDESRQKVLGLLDGLNMLLVTPSGCAITVDECRSLINDAGFATTDTTHDEPYTILVGWKALRNQQAVEDGRSTAS